MNRLTGIFAPPTGHRSATVIAWMANLCETGAHLKYLLSLWIGLAATGALSAQSVTYTYQVIHRYPHDVNAFTQGLAYHDGYLYEGTGLYGGSAIRKLDLETGTVLQQQNLDATRFGEGITLLDGKLYQITWRENEAYVYDLETLQRVNTFTYFTEGWGLATDGEHLIMSDGSSTVYFRDPETFEERRRVTVRDGLEAITRINELEYVDGQIWANIWMRNRIARIDPTNGQVLGWIDLRNILQLTLTDPEAVLNGIALDASSGRIFVTGKRWPFVYHIAIHSLESAPPPAWLEPLNVTGDLAKITIPTFRSFRYELSEAVGLHPATWSASGAIITADGYPHTFDLPAPGSFSARFYRVETQPPQ